MDFKEVIRSLTFAESVTVMGHLVSDSRAPSPQAYLGVSNDRITYDSIAEENSHTKT